MENTDKFGRLDPRNLGKAMEETGNNGGKGPGDTETPKIPIEDGKITVTKEILNDMIASVVATHMKMTEAERRQARGAKENQIIRLDEEEEAQLGQKKEKERVKALISLLQGEVKNMKERADIEGSGSPKVHPFSPRVLQA